MPEAVNGFWMDNQAVVPPGARSAVQCIFSLSPFEHSHTFAPRPTPTKWTELVPVHIRFGPTQIT